MLFNKGIRMRKQELHPRTAVVNKTQKNQSKRARTEALAWLALTFPNVFDNSICIRPLKAGIMDDLLQYADKAAEAGISKSKLREAVVLFTRRLDYLACLKLREPRIDLQGNPLCEVTQEEADHAAAKIKKRVDNSARNARKLIAALSAMPTTPHSHSSAPSYAAKPVSAPAFVSAEDYLPTYPARAPSFSSQNVVAQPVRSASVVVKHKTTRQFDPSAVARLKEKLGLSRSMEKKELVE